MFNASYFAPRYFARRYFPGGGIVVPPVRPPIRTGVSVPPRRVHIPAIHGIADLLVPVPQFDAIGFVSPAANAGTWDAVVPVDVVLEAIGAATPAAIRASAALQFADAFELAAVGTTQPAVKRRTDDDEENLLLEHYMLTLQMLRKR